MQIIRSLTLHLEVERWPLAAPFRISGHTFEFIEVIVVTLSKDGTVGLGEAAGVYYKEDTPASMKTQIESIRGEIEVGISHSSLQQLLPPGGGRNALDCALWDLRSKLTGRPVWQLAGLEPPRPLITTFTCSANDPDKMAVTAAGYTGAQAIKLKLTGDAIDSERVRQVRQARPDVWLSVDANQGFTPESLERLMPTLTAARVSLIEQPFRVGEETLLDKFTSPIPIAADESVQSASDLANAVGRFSVINIKLDKCGGLTEGLDMARESRKLGLKTMVGNMLGTSLSMAPSFLIGQLCDFADLDGPVFLTRDRSRPVSYINGLITCPDNVWGNG